MGSFGSKVDVKAGEKIETDVVNLIVRLSDEEFKIDEHLRDEILKALQIYRKEIENTTGYISGKKAGQMKNLIEEAENKLQHFPSHKVESRDFYTRGKKLHELRNFVADIGKRLKSGKIKDNEFEYLLAVATECSYKLVKDSCLKNEEQSSVSNLLLKLYLKSPPIKISKVIKQKRELLKQYSELFSRFHLNNINALHVEETRNELKEFKSEVDSLNQVTSKAINYVEQGKEESLASDYHSINRSTSKVSKIKAKFELPKSVSKTVPKRHENISLVLKKVDDDLNHYNKIIENLCPPVSSDAVSTMTTKINELLNFCNKPEKNANIAEKKQHLSKKGAELISRLENIDKENKRIEEDLETIKDIEDKIFLVMESSTKFEEKVKALDLYLKVLSEMDRSNNEVLNQSTEIMNRIQGFLILETANFLRQLSTTVDHHQMYAEEFPFPISVGTYEAKQKQIRSLLDRLDHLPKTNLLLQERIKIIEAKVLKASETLQVKATKNESVFAILEFLDNMKRKLVDSVHVESSVCEHLNRCNMVRKELEGMRNLNHRISAKKNEILSYLHVYESEVYSREFSEIQEIKEALNQCEKHVQEFVYPLSHENYQKKRDEIISLYEAANTKLIKYDDDFKHTFCNAVNIILDLLKKTAQENEDVCSRLDRLNNVEESVKGLKQSGLSLEKQKEFLEQHNQMLQQMQSACEKRNILDVIKNIEISIGIEKAKIDLILGNNNLPVLKERIEKLAHPINPELFKENLGLLVIAREYIEDMPEGEKDLDTQKQTYLREIFKILRLLDEEVAKAASTRKQTENFLELQTHFNDFNSETTVISKSTTDFVQIICKRAENFEAGVKFYLGSRNSVDFYVIHENLVRLLEELDYVVCEYNEELLKQTVAAMDYVKRLIEELNFNATDD